MSFQKVAEAEFLRGEHDVLRFWNERGIFNQLRAQNAHGERWSFLDGPITANNPMGVHHAWGRTYKDAFQRFQAMQGKALRYQNGFDCQGLWVEVEVQKELGLSTKHDIERFGMDRFVNECKKRVLKFAARQTEQSIRLGYWMDWDRPDELRKLAESLGHDLGAGERGSGGAGNVPLSLGRGARGEGSDGGSIASVTSRSAGRSEDTTTSDAAGQPLTPGPSHQGEGGEICYTTASGEVVNDVAHRIVERLGNRNWGGSYFTFSTENNETIWTFLKKCHERGKIARGHDVMPWSGLAGSAYSQMEVADGRRLTTHRSVFVRFPIIETSRETRDERRETSSTMNPASLSLGRGDGGEGSGGGSPAAFNASSAQRAPSPQATSDAAGQPLTPGPSPEGEGDEFLNPQPSTPNPPEYLLVWTTTPWTLTSNVAAAVNPELDYVKLQAKRDGAIYYFAKDNLDAKRMEKEFKEGFGRPEWTWPEGTPKLKSLSQIFKEQGGYEILGTIKGVEMVGWRYRGPFDDLPAQSMPGGVVAGMPQASSSTMNRAPLSLGRGEGGEGSDAGSPASFTASSAGRAKAPQATSGAAGRPLTPNPSPQGEGDESLNSQLTAIECHRVIDGGRDNKGNANVTTGEGTGIVHIAPGCGDIDHKLGVEHGLVSIAPLAEDGTFVEGFGEFTGQKATNPIVPQMVIDHLKRQGFHVADEVYPHIYPFCWRTGDELVFRLVDEWFVDMSWRDEIKEVVKAIEWLPPSIQGQERELEWLTNMRDWMISKKRFWGLALPIWVDEQTGEFEVIGSLAELKERAVEGWSDFEGHTPHRPWIDAVKIKSQTTGNVMSRVPDVGNPWLDAGIVPFSTMGFREAGDRESGRAGEAGRAYWKRWYPADLVLECFPGQFRNWFYSLLSMSTMMMHGETDDPEQKRPFKTLFGHRLVMNEEGQPMHKSDGTAIWFEEAAEQLGVDTLRWLYLSQNPSSDLRFGTRHPDQHVTLNTPDGPITKTKEGFTTCLVTSKPADETRRQVLIPLWNSYAFFVNYARLDGFDPSAPQMPYSERQEIDQWIWARLQELIETSEKAWSAYEPAEACRAAAEFVDDLSNWYIRRNRRRFWRGKSEGDADKLAAYQTLYEVLVTLTKLLAPALPFLTERMFQNLVRSWDASAPESVHLCRFPRAAHVEFADYRIDLGLADDMRVVQQVVRQGHRLREESSHRVRQPLAELRWTSRNDHAVAAIRNHAEIIADELNVKSIIEAEHLDELVTYTYKPNLKTLGPKHGKRLAAIRNELPSLGDEQLAPLRRGETVTVTIGGEPLELSPEDVMIGTSQAAEWVTASDGGVQLALSTKLTPELIREGLARDFVRQIQQMRKDAGLEIEDRIIITYVAEGEAAEAIEQFAEYIKNETLADRLERVASLPDGTVIRIGEHEVRVKIERV